jgi:hypothetical protein
MPGVCLPEQALDGAKARARRMCDCCLARDGMENGSLTRHGVISEFASGMAIWYRYSSHTSGYLKIPRGTQEYLSLLRVLQIARLACLAPDAPDSANASTSTSASANKATPVLKPRQRKATCRHKRYATAVPT